MTSSREKAALRKGVEVADRYRIIDVLGVGGVGAVYEAEHIGLGRRVALKILLPKYVENERMLSRFLQEARAAAAIGHPGIVEAFDVGRDDDMVFIAMELLEGEELQARLKREQPLSEEFILRVGIDLADAVAAAHEHGIVHRDLKPQNIFLANARKKKDVVKVLDFGLAKLTRSDEDDALITKSGEVFGTPMYMAPEHLRSARDVDGRADVYAMGAILYQALTGRTPFQATSFAELVLKITSESPPALTELRPGITPALAAIVESCMRKERDERPSSAADLRDALSECLRQLHEPLVSTRPLRFSPSEPRREEPSSPDVDEVDHDEEEVPAEDHADQAAAHSRVEGARGKDEAPLRRGMTPTSVVIGAALIIAIGVGGSLMWMSRGAGADDPPATEGESLRQTAPRTEATDSSHPVARREKTPSSIELRIEASPSDATISIDDAMAPSNPFTGRFPHDGLSHSVRVEAEGYQRWAQMVVFDKNRHIQIALTKVQESSMELPRSLQGKTAEGKTSNRPQKSEASGPQKTKHVFSPDEDPWGE